MNTDGHHVYGTTGTLVVLDCPPTSEFGIDLNSWSTGWFLSFFFFFLFCFVFLYVLCSFLLLSFFPFLILSPTIRPKLQRGQNDSSWYSLCFL